MGFRPTKNMKVLADIPPLTPEQLAEAFWDMDDEQQAKFFSHLGACVLATKDSLTGQTQSYLPLDMQMWHAKRKCSSNGARVMECFSQSNDHSGIQSFYLPSHQPVKKGN